jgi:hypothetical protein
MKPVSSGFDTPEMTAGRPRGLRFTHSLRLETLGFELDVRANLVLEIAL